MDLSQILQRLVQNKAPDLHLKVGSPPIVRLVNGELYPVEGISPLTPDQVYEIGKAITNDKKYAMFEKHHEVDFSYGVDHLGRFRVNMFMEKDGPAIAFRVIPEVVPDSDDLLIPPVVNSLALKPRGLVLVTGPTGSGKSTTLATMIESINQKRRCHILTIEDPIEFVFQPKLALITQREVNFHTDSFSSAIRSALRQDPDVIMVGEMRDLETIAAAITLAESGHLVLSTLHTTDAPQTVDRIIDVFPPYQQAQIRTQLSFVLRGVVSQTILPKKDGKGRVVAFEIMLVNDGIRHCIKEANTSQIYSMMQIGKDEGMQTLDDALGKRVAQGYISEEAAYSKAHDVEILRMALAG